ncbi:MAG: sigma-70 family RNA polymerase sigma factor [Hyphomicrobiaceae bacterium]|nr:sigma-70 family RNA polymerase sigma factor [Hyphomicrobiaceae bacterium]
MTEGSDQDRRLASLMRSAQDGDDRAYAALLGEVAPLIRRMVRRRLAFLQPQDVEDLVQDVLLSLHAARATYQPARPFLPWATAIVRNRMVDRARRHARQAANEVESDRVSETFAAETTNMHEEGYGDAEALRQALGRLPPGQRRAIELVKLKEMSLNDAAAVSGASAGALKVAVHRGIAALRKALGAKGSAKD